MPDRLLRNALLAAVVGLVALAYVLSTFFQNQWVLAPLIWVYVVPGVAASMFLLLQGATWIFSKLPGRTRRITT